MASIPKKDGRRGNGDRRKKEKFALYVAVLGTIKPPPEGLTLVQLAELCGCSRSTINNIEHSALKKLRLRSGRLRALMGRD